MFFLLVQKITRWLGCFLLIVLPAAYASGQCLGILPSALSVPVAHCDSNASVCLPFAPADLLRYELRINGQLASGVPGGCSGAVQYFYDLGLLPGQGLNGPYVLQSWIVGARSFQGISFQNTEVLADSMRRWDPSGNWKLDVFNKSRIIGGITGTSYGSLRIQSTNGATKVIAPGQNSGNIGAKYFFKEGFYRLILKDKFSLCADTLLLDVPCTKGTSRTLNLSVKPNDSLLLCLGDLKFPAGSTGTISCLPNALINISTTGQSDCFLINAGAFQGFDHFCLFLCNPFGECQTILFNVHVFKPLKLPGYVKDDRFQLNNGSSAIFNVSANDSITLSDTLRILTYPIFGFFQWFDDGTFEYRASTNFCGVDSFSYLVCNRVCDTAWVFITSICSKVKAYNAFSPNGDGVNDTWIIEGVEDFPEALVRVYNRWGNLVLKTKAYQNDWAGTWAGKPLPDGTYFFEVRAEHPDFIPLTGWVEIRR